MFIKKEGEKLDKDQVVDKKLDKKNIFWIIILTLLFLALLVGFYIKGRSNIKVIDGKDYSQNSVNLNDENAKIETGVVNKTKDSDIIDFVAVKKQEKKKIDYRRLVKISSEKTAGINFWGKVQGAYDIEYFTEDGRTFKAFSNVFKENIDNELLSAEINSEAYRDIYSVDWISKDKRVIVYADRYGNKKIVISGKNGNKVLSGKIETISVADDGKVFYILVKNEKAEGYVLNPYINETKLVFKSELTQWNSDWRGTNRVLVYPKPLSGKKNAAYLINTSTGVFRKENFELYGLTAKANPIVSKIAYFGKESKKGEQKIFIKDLVKNKITKYNFKTFADKCVWSKNNIDLYCAFPKIIRSVKKSEPDLWYKGLTEFEDKVVVINTEKGYVRELFDPETPYGYRFDMEKVKLSKNDDYLYFTDKNSLTTWFYKINRSSL